MLMGGGGDLREGGGGSRVVCGRVVKTLDSPDREEVGQTPSIRFTTSYLQPLP